MGIYEGTPKYGGGYVTGERKYTEVEYFLSDKEIRICLGDEISSYDYVNQMGFIYLDPKNATEFALDILAQLKEAGYDLNGEKTNE